MLRYALTILVSAFLLFQVQPLIAKRILPWFGGSPAVWTTCMLFFQVLLLAGYTYAHLLSRLAPKRQFAIHIVLLLVALVFLPIEPDTSWKPTDSQMPALRILLLLTATVGLPYGLLSTTGPLIQAWFSATHPGRSPYRLFALSNTGSLLALLTYPAVFEPWLRVHTQIVGWSAGFVVFVVACASCAWKVRQAGFQPHVLESDTGGHASTAQPDASRPSRQQLAVWIGLAAMPSIMLLATTNQMCQEVAVVPFLWVVPLSLYLISFIICFDSERWYSRPVFALALWLLAALAIVCLYRGTTVALPLQVLIYSATLFVCCMTCHGELAKSKPEARHLTLFYLAVSLGGALGGVFVVVVAPNVFPVFLEYHVGLAGCVLMTLVGWWRATDWVLHDGRPTAAWVGLMGLLGGLFAALIVHVYQDTDDVVEQRRNFYGVLTVVEREDDLGKYTLLRHGRISHGFQYHDTEKQTWPVSYYGEQSGVGLAILYHPARMESSSMQVGVIGLGTGTLATYGRSMDRYRFYDINPDVLDAARTHFTYLENCPADLDVVLGDARVMLERQLQDGERQEFDVLAVDAFSSDAIPMHLLTRECFELYFEHLADGGVLAVHISNRFLHLEPVVKTLADELQLEAASIEYRPDSTTDERHRYDASSWVLVCRDRQFLDSEVIRPFITDWDSDLPELLWTDDFGSLWPILEHADMFDNLKSLFDVTRLFD